MWCDGTDFPWIIVIPEKGRGVVKEIITILISAVICYLVSTLIHELGHVVCGLLHHWKLFMLVVGPMKLYRETTDSKIKIGFERNPLLWGGGQEGAEEAKLQLGNMKKIKDKVPKTIVDDCKKEA